MYVHSIYYKCYIMKNLEYIYKYHLKRLFLIFNTIFMFNTMTLCNWTAQSYE